MKITGRLLRAAGVLLIFCAAAVAATPPHAKPRTVPAAGAAPTEKDLEQYSRALKKKNYAAAYAKLSALATRQPLGVLGMRAALGLGYFDYNKANYVQAAKWLDRALADPLLRDHSLYWSAETSIALGHNAEALAQLKRLRHDFPDSVVTEQALQSLGTAALSSNQPAEAIAALDAYSATTERPALLFLRAEARELAGQKLQAAADYQAVYLRFPLSDQSREAGMKLDYLHKSLGDQLPPIPIDQRLAHAATLFGARQWSEARAEYAQLLLQLAGAELERASLRILECGVALGGGPSAINALQVSDPDVDAERLYSLANYYRLPPQETPMIAAVEAAAARAPLSHWSEAALFLAGNYFWVQLDRDRASSYYKRVVDNFPAAADATAAHWRVAWAAVLKRQPESAELLADHLRRFPGSQFTPDAVYWLGRLAEESGNAALARSYYGKLQQRFPQNYFQGVASSRLQALGSGAIADADVLAMIPPVPLAQPMGDLIPAAAAARQARADALHSIAFDSSAELELRAGYAATGEPRLLLEAAQASVSAGHCGAAFATVRQLYPQLESRPYADVPREAWQAAFPLPFEGSIRQWSGHAGVDPMLTAGLIRQESAFEPEARSPANAMGLMQLLPKTARLVAQQARVRYTRAQLFDPDYNVHLGTIYFSGLRKTMGNVESALAAYNAGEDRVGQWTAGQSYREIAEFVDSIPFTETREYVEIVSRNAEIYREIYGVQNESRKPTPRRGRERQNFR
ncbi:MAG TPA: transglycosylase SLT domain-containing protein [Candidatus Limnocylindria bacterium]|nr:transglycosylase SLT domain-containing protein [Candidatus Limnocylindria bacterium]